jgi:type II secretory pathway pseudopilin PulG
MHRRRRGFTRVQLLIALAVTLIILVIGAAYLLRSRMAANENAARESLHAYNLALYEYWTIYETYPKSLANLGAGSDVGVASADLIDPVLASGGKSGYVFAYLPGELDFDGTTSTFNLVAKPRVVEVTGRLSFVMDQTGVIRTVMDSSAGGSTTP